MEKKKVLDFFKCATGYFLTDLQDFCGGVAKMCAPVAAAAVGAAGAAAVGTADAFLTGNQSSETETDRLKDAYGFDLYPEAHDFSHPFWDDFWGVPMRSNA